MDHLISTYFNYFGVDIATETINDGVPSTSKALAPAVPRAPWHHGLRRSGPGMGACRDIFGGMGWARMDTESDGNWFRNNTFFFSAPKGSSFAYERGILEPTEDWGVSAAPGIKVENI